MTFRELEFRARHEIGPPSQTRLSLGLALFTLSLLGTRPAAGSASVASPSSERDSRLDDALWLRVRGGYEREEMRQRVFGLLEIGVALDTLIGGDAHALADAAHADRLATAAEDRLAETPFEASSPAPPRPYHAPPDSAPCTSASGCDAAPRHPLSLPEHVVPPFAPKAASAAPAASTEQLTAALGRAAVAAALRVADSAAPEQRLDSLASRSRTAASLPEVRLAAGSSRDQSQKLSPTVTDPARFTQDGGRDLWFETRLTWRLERAIFSRDEIAIERLRAQEREARRRTTHQVLEALLDWQRARRAQRSELLHDDERDAAALRELDATLRLDALTDGWFSRHLAQASPTDPQTSPSEAANLAERPPER